MWRIRSRLIRRFGNPDTLTAARAARTVSLLRALGRRAAIPNPLAPLAIEAEERRSRGNQPQERQLCGSATGSLARFGLGHLRERFSPRNVGAGSSLRHLPTMIARRQRAVL